MRILHYALGFPPYRSGGLTKFCMDLMVQQKIEGNNVALLWPGQMKLFNKKVMIVDRQAFLYSNEYIHSFELINPLPVSYDEGIQAFDQFTLSVDKNIYRRFLELYKPNVIHIHTLMGIHKEFIEAANELKIRIVFTAHDFFPICPKVTLFRNGKVCDCAKECTNCASCNSSALSLNKIVILQSPLYRNLKDSKVVKKLRKSHRDNYLSDESSEKIENIKGNLQDYKDLRNYYYSMLKMMDIIHYNSSITQNVYEKYFNLPKNVIIPVTHCDIQDHRHLKDYNHDVLKIRYLGPQSSAKGFYLLIDALDEIWNDNKKFELHIHFNPMNDREYIRIHDRYSYEQLKQIFDDTDVLIVPSILYETFGFTTIEALSYGVPVIVSENVGAKDVLRDKYGIVLKQFNKDVLVKCLKNINMQRLKQLNMNIVKKYNPYLMNNMSKSINEKCY